MAIANIAENLAEARKRKGWGIKRLARESGLSPNTIRSAERGTNVSQGTIERLARTLDVSLDELDSGFKPDANNLPMLDYAFRDGGKSSILGDVDFVATNIRAKNLCPSDAPSSTAWAMLRWARACERNESEFWTTTFPKFTACRAQIEADARRENPGEKLDRMLRESIAGFRKLLVNKRYRCPRCDGVYVFKDEYFPPVD